jgi:heat shock protein HtpX
MHTRSQNLIAVKNSNRTKTFFLMAVFLGGIIFFGLIISALTGTANYLYGSIIFAVVLNFVSFFFGSTIALRTSGAILADEEKYKDLYQIVASLSEKSSLPVPSIYVIQEAGPNAFACGRNEHNACLAFTTGLLATLTKSELEGVVAHELSHIKNKDMLVMTITVVLAGVMSMLAHVALTRSFTSRDDRDNALVIFVVGIIASIVLPVAASIIQMAISRNREFMADASGALLTAYPEGLASALRKISAYSQPLMHASPSTAHLYIACPFGGVERQTFFQKLFMTHPPIEERIEALIGKQEEEVLV